MVSDMVTVCLLLLPYTANINMLMIMSGGGGRDGVD